MFVVSGNATLKLELLRTLSQNLGSKVPFIPPLNLCRSNWESYVPHTNVLWLNYLVTKISQSGKLKDISRRTWRAKFRPYLKEILQFSSAQEASMKLFYQSKS